MPAALFSITLFMKYLITGANGYIGLRRALSAQ